MQVRRWRTVLRSILPAVLLVSTVGCSPSANEPLVTGSPPSEDEEVILEPVGYFYEDDILEFVIPQCFGPIINVTATDTYSTDFASSWRAGNPVRMLEGIVRADGRDFQSVYGDASVLSGNVSVIIVTARRLDVLMELPAFAERTTPKRGNAIMQDGAEVTIESIANSDEPCAKVTSVPL